MHTLELDDNTYENLVKYAAQAGKTPSQWLQELITQVQNKSRSIGLAKDKGVPLPDEFLTAFSGIDFENPKPITELFGKAKGCFKDATEVDAFIREGRGEDNYFELKKNADLIVPDAFFDPLPIEKSKQKLKISDLVGQVSPCFSSAAEIDAFIRAERDAWDD